MKTFFFIALLAIGMIAGAQTIKPTQLAISPLTIMNKDSISLVVSQDIVGVMGKSIVNAVGHKDSTEAVYIGWGDEENGFNGITVSDKGKFILIETSIVIIARPSFASHAQADASLYSGQEYFLMGDRAIYRKP